MTPRREHREFMERCERERLVARVLQARKALAKAEADLESHDRFRVELAFFGAKLVVDRWIQRWAPWLIGGGA